MPTVPSVRTENRRRGLLGFASGFFGRKAIPQNLGSISDRGWFPIVRESFAGAWQRNIVESTESVLAYHAVYACVTLIASDVAKCRLRLVEQDSNGIWSEVSAPAFSPVLRRPNRHQNRIKFIEQWVISKLVHGNTYVLKGRDERRVVTSLYVLDPLRTKPLVAPNGDVYYQLAQDNLSGVPDQNVIVPASEIIHDVMVPLYHPLCGVSPLSACGLAAAQGLAIQRNSTRFFQNGSRPGGILSAPGSIDDATATRLKKHWEENYTGENAGRVAVLGDGLKYEAMTVSAEDAQLIEQLKWTAETVCSCFHVPAYKVGVGAAPSYNNVEALDQQYYSQCLQKLFECIELCLDDGLGLTAVEGKTYGAEFDLDDLLRMDTATQVKTLGDAIKGILAPNEARRKLGYKPVTGGDAVLVQQQNYSVEALAKRDQRDDPFSRNSAPPPARNSDMADDSAEADGEGEKRLRQNFRSYHALHSA